MLAPKPFCMYKASNATPVKGRLLVKVIQTTGVDDVLGIELPHAPTDQALARVIKTSSEEYPVGATVMYDRLHGKTITLLDELDAPSDYKVVQTVDISLILLE